MGERILMADAQDNASPRMETAQSTSQPRISDTTIAAPSSKSSSQSPSPRASKHDERGRPSVLFRITAVNNVVSSIIFGARRVAGSVLRKLSRKQVRLSARGIRGMDIRVLWETGMYCSEGGQRVSVTRFVDGRSDTRPCGTDRNGHIEDADLKIITLMSSGGVEKDSGEGFMTRGASVTTTTDVTPVTTTSEIKLTNMTRSDADGDDRHADHCDENGLHVRRIVDLHMSRPLPAEPLVHKVLMLVRTEMENKRGARMSNSVPAQVLEKRIVRIGRVNKDVTTSDDVLVSMPSPTMPSLETKPRRGSFVSVLALEDILVKPEARLKKEMDSAKELTQETKPVDVEEKIMEPVAIVERESNLVKELEAIVDQEMNAKEIMMPVPPDVLAKPIKKLVRVGRDGELSDNLLNAPPKPVLPPTSTKPKTKAIASVVDSVVKTDSNDLEIADSVQYAEDSKQEETQQATSMLLPIKLVTAKVPRPSELPPAPVLSSVALISSTNAYKPAVLAPSPASLANQAKKAVTVTDLVAKTDEELEAEEMNDSVPELPMFTPRHNIPSGEEELMEELKEETKEEIKDDFEAEEMRDDVPELPAFTPRHSVPNNEEEIKTELKEDLDAEKMDDKAPELPVLVPSPASIAIKAKAEVTVMETGSEAAEKQEEDKLREDVPNLPVIEPRPVVSNKSPLLRRKAAVSRRNVVQVSSPKLRRTSTRNTVDRPSLDTIPETSAIEAPVTDINRYHDKMRDVLDAVQVVSESVGHELYPSSLDATVNTEASSSAVVPVDNTPPAEDIPSGQWIVTVPTPVRLIIRKGTVAPPPLPPRASLTPRISRISTECFFVHHDDMALTRYGDSSWKYQRKADRDFYWRGKESSEDVNKRWYEEIIMPVQEPSNLLVQSPAYNLENMTRSTDDVASGRLKSILKRAGALNTERRSIGFFEHTKVKYYSVDDAPFMARDLMRLGEYGYDDVEFVGVSVDGVVNTKDGVNIGKNGDNQVGNIRIGNDQVVCNEKEDDQAAGSANGNDQAVGSASSSATETKAVDLVSERSIVVWKGKGSMEVLEEVIRNATMDEESGNAVVLPKIWKDKGKMVSGEASVNRHGSSLGSAGQINDILGRLGGYQGAEAGLNGHSGVNADIRVVKNKPKSAFYVTANGILSDSPTPAEKLFYECVVQSYKNLNDQDSSMVIMKAREYQEMMVIISKNGSSSKGPVPGHYDTPARVTIPRTAQDFMASPFLLEIAFRTHLACDKQWFELYANGKGGNSKESEKKPNGPKDASKPTQKKLSQPLKGVVIRKDTDKAATNNSESTPRSSVAGSGRPTLGGWIHNKLSQSGSRATGSSDSVAAAAVDSFNQSNESEQEEPRDSETTIAEADPQEAAPATVKTSEKAAKGRRAFSVFRLLRRSSRAIVGQSAAASGAAAAQVPAPSAEITQAAAQGSASGGEISQAAVANNAFVAVTAEAKFTGGVSAAAASVDSDRAAVNTTAPLIPLMSATTLHTIDQDEGIEIAPAADPAPFTAITGQNAVPKQKQADQQGLKAQKARRSFWRIGSRRQALASSN